MLYDSVYMIGAHCTCSPGTAAPAAQEQMQVHGRQPGRRSGKGWIRGRLRHWLEFVAVMLIYIVMLVVKSALISTVPARPNELMS